MEDLKDLYLLSLYAFVRVPEAQIPEDTVDEQFTLTSGGTYYFDLSGVSIPGTANESLPDKTMRYVPFTYAGTVDAYKPVSYTHLDVYKRQSCSSPVDFLNSSVSVSLPRFIPRHPVSVPHHRQMLPHGVCSIPV